MIINKFKIIISIITILAASPKLFCQTQLLNHITNKSNFIVSGIVQDIKLLEWKTSLHFAIIIKIDDVIKGKIDTIEISHLMFRNEIYELPEGWTPPTKVTKGEKYIFFIRSIDKKRENIRIRPHPINSGGYFMNVKVSKIKLTDAWVHGVDYNKKLESEIANKVLYEKDSTIKKSNDWVIFSSRDSMVNYSERYVDIGKVIKIVNVKNNDQFQYKVTIEIIGYDKNTDKHVLRQKYLDVYLKKINCICQETLTENRRYAFFLKREGDILTLIDQNFGIIENNIWNYKLE